MEKNTVTIEIKQEVSVTLLWIVGGVIVVSLAFFLAPSSTELWPSLNAAGIAAAIYLVAMMAFALRKPLKTSLRLWVGIAALVSLGLGAFTWMRMQDQTEWQAETLMKIRGIIGRGVMRYDMISTTALKTFEDFYQQRGPQKKSLADIFLSQHAGAAVGVNIHKPQYGNDSVQVIVTRIEPGLIELVSQEAYVKGRDPKFKNHNGQIGMIQEKITLTEKGITHVSEN